MKQCHLNQYTLWLLFAITVLLVSTALFEFGYYMGTKHIIGQGILAVPGGSEASTTFSPLFAEERRALSGVVKDIHDDILVVQEDAISAGQDYSFKNTPTTNVVRIVPNNEKDTKTGNVAMTLFPFTIANVAFVDIKVGDRVFVLSEDTIPQGTRKVLPLLEVKIQPK